MSTASQDSVGLCAHFVYIFSDSPSSLRTQHELKMKWATKILTWHIEINLEYLEAESSATGLHQCTEANTVEVSVMHSNPAADL